jgi:hypothetical protein
MNMELVTKIGIVIVFTFIAIASLYIGSYKGQPNNPVEQLAEKVIDVELGTDLGSSIPTPK